MPKRWHESMFDLFTFEFIDNRIFWLAKEILHVIDFRSK